MQRRCDR